MKTCTKCNKLKPFSDFHKKNDKRRKNSLYQPVCKVCKRFYMAEYHKTNAEKRKQYMEKTFKKKNPDYYRQYYRDNKLSRDEYSKWYGSIRRANKLNATPCWLTEDHLKEIENLYWLAGDLQRVSGQAYHVDHIIPLKGENVCGLHVPWNLQVLPSDLNIAKGNRV